MTYPKTFFFSTSEAERPATCFVLMPFSDAMRPVYEAIRDALQAPGVGFACSRADELYGGEQVMSGVLREMARAFLVVADLTDRNPNVFYELGVAHTTKDAERVLLLAQSIKDVPFDLSAYRCILYVPTPEGLERLRTQVQAAAKTLAGQAYPFTLNTGDSHKTEPIFPGPDRHLYSLELQVRMVGIGFAKCWVRARKHELGGDASIVEDDSYGISEGETRHVNGFPWLVRLDRVIDGGASFAIVAPRVET